jgi:hypothetical protein
MSLKSNPDSAQCSTAQINSGREQAITGMVFIDGTLSSLYDMRDRRSSQDNHLEPSNLSSETTA